MTTLISLEKLTKIFNELEENSKSKSCFLHYRNIKIEKQTKSISLPSIDYNQKNKFAKILKLKMQGQQQEQMKAKV